MGLMIIKDKSNWVKTGIEFIDCQHVSCVVTKEFSDWNVSRIEDNPKFIELKLTRIQAKIIIEYRLPNNPKWFLSRKFQFFADALQVGLMSCSPQRKDISNKFKARFVNFCCEESSVPLNDPVPD